MGRRAVGASATRVLQAINLPRGSLMGGSPIHPSDVHSNLAVALPPPGACRPGVGRGPPESRRRARPCPPPHRSRGRAQVRPLSPPPSDRRYHAGTRSGSCTWCCRSRVRAGPDEQAGGPMVGACRAPRDCVLAPCDRRAWQPVSPSTSWLAGSMWRAANGWLAGSVAPPSHDPTSSSAWRRCSTSAPNSCSTRRSRSWTYDSCGWPPASARESSRTGCTCRCPPWRAGSPAVPPGPSDARPPSCWHGSSTSRWTRSSRQWRSP